MGLVQGKVALVTGAGRGIGESSARLFAAEGASVVVADVDGEAALRVAEAIATSGGNAVAVQADVTDEDQVIAMVATAMEHFGRLDCAHNNAGISGTVSTFTDLSLSEWNRMITINLTSVFLSMKHEIPAILASGGGAIVNTSSGAGVVGFAGLPHYVASKHGVVGLTKTAAIEYAKQGLRVNAVLPGTTKTVGRGRLGEPEEIAEAAVWLCSDRASFVSGESMLVDGATVCR
jgi:NAD(P)-dependent dehydrogenase (short-subunit alcohol dehydrogenase family)